MENLFASLASGTSLGAYTRRKRKSSSGVVSRHSDGDTSRLTTVEQVKKRTGEIRSSSKKGGLNQVEVDHKSCNLRLFADTTHQQKKKSTEVSSEVKTLRRCKPSGSSSDSEEVGESKHEEDAVAVAVFRKRLGIKGGSAMFKSTSSHPDTAYLILLLLLAHSAILFFHSLYDNLMHALL